MQVLSVALVYHASEHRDDLVIQTNEHLKLEINLSLSEQCEQCCGKSAELASGAQALSSLRRVADQAA